MAETNVQIEVARTGQKIRNLSASVLQSDGTVATVLMQVVTLSDDQGRVLNLDALDHLDDLLFVTKEVRGLLKLIAGVLTNSSVERLSLEDL